MGMQYRNLDVMFRRDGDGDWQIEIESVVERFVVPFEISATMADLAARLIDARKNPRDDVKAADLAVRIQAIGQDIYRTLSVGSLKEVLELNMREIRSQPNQGLRLRFCWDPADQELNQLGALPWELALSGIERFGLTTDLPVSRFLVGDVPIPRCSDREIRVLMVASEPRGSDTIKAEEEKRELRRAVRHHHKLYVGTERAVISRVRERLIRGRFHVLHFIGHGSYEPDTGAVRILWETEDKGQHPLSAQEFAEQIAQLDDLRLVVLSSCWSATLSNDAEHDVYHAIAPALLRRGVPAVVGMRFPVTHAAAIDFSRKLYSFLADGYPIDAAVTEARLYLAGKKNPEWITPTVFMQTEDGKILEILDDKTRELKIGINNFDDGYGNGMEARSDRFLALEEFFECDDRTIRGGPCHWNESLLPELQTFLSQLFGDRRRMLFDFSTLWSITYATGYILEAKSGLSSEVFQRGIGPDSGVYMRVDKQKLKEYDRELWAIEILDREDEIADVALAISVTWNVIDQVKDFLKQPGAPSIGRLIHARIEPEVGSRSVENGAHSLRLAEGLVTYIQDKLGIDQKRATLHIFCSAPNVFCFHLGQLSRTIQEIQLYEHLNPKVSGYRPSFRLRPPKPCTCIRCR